MELLNPEKNKSEQRYLVYKVLTQYPEWKFFIEDLKSVIEDHRQYSVTYSQQNKTVDAQRQALIIMGIEEAMTHPKDTIEHHESFWMKVKRQACAMCGNIFSKVTN